jgi:hypothetical protein
MSKTLKTLFLQTLILSLITGYSCITAEEIFQKILKDVEKKTSMSIHIDQCGIYDGEVKNKQLSCKFKYQHCLDEDEANEQKLRKLIDDCLSLFENDVAERNKKIKTKENIGSLKQKKESVKSKMTQKAKETKPKIPETQNQLKKATKKEKPEVPKIENKYLHFLINEDENKPYNTKLKELQIEANNYFKKEGQVFKRDLLLEVNETNNLQVRLDNDTCDFSGLSWENNEFYYDEVDFELFWASCDVFIEKAKNIK